MNLIEISEREVIDAARRAVASARNDGRILPTVEAFMPLAKAVALLEERERVAEQIGEVRDIACGPDDELSGLTDAAKGAEQITYPPMAEGQCHWESDGKIVGPTVNCKHLPDPATSSRDENQAQRGPRLETLASSRQIEAYQGLEDVPPRPGAEPITRPPKKLSKKAQAIEARRQSDPLGQGRDDIDYSDDSLPTAR